MNGISAVIIAYNEEQHIDRCLASLKGVVDEVVVYDSGSRDATQYICRDFGARLVIGPWEGYSNTKNNANLLATHEYILSLDADEALSDELRESILKVKPNMNGAYEFNRLNNYYGSWIRYGGFYPDKKIRLFPRREGRWEGQYVHEEMILTPGTTIHHLEGDLLHYTCKDITEHVERINKYSELAAREMMDGHRVPRLWKILFSPPARFIKGFFLKKGFLDGMPGFIVNILSAYSVALRYVKLWLLKSQNPVL
jgi:glycosyltransferase involved in cell wall biosynthesis